MKMQALWYNRLINWIEGDPVCGRYQVDIDIEELREILDEVNRKSVATPESGQLKIGEIAPTNVGAVIGKDGPEAMAWSYPREADHKPVFNARIDTPSWKYAIDKQRVVVPTSGFYEWTHANGKPKDRYLFRIPQESVLYLAGIYVYHKSQEGQRQRRFLILTTEPNESVASYHNRMPVCLMKSQVSEWINDAESAHQILSRPQPQLVATASERDNPQQMSLF